MPFFPYFSHRPGGNRASGGNDVSVSLEWRLVFLLARSTVDERALDDILQAAEPDWRQVFEISHAHRVFPLVYRNIKNLCAGRLPGDLLEQQRREMLKLAGLNMAMTAGLTELLDLFSANRIQVVPFKGPVLSQILYGDVIYRGFGDLDLLIHPEDLPRAVRLLERNGFSAAFHLSDDQLMRLVRTEKEYILRHDKTGLELDLQWELTGGYFSSGLTLEKLLPECETLSLEGRQIHVFGKEDLFMYLCIHGNMHVWEQLDHVCCVAGLISKEEPDWEKVLGKSRAIGCERILKIGILLAGRLLGAEVPPDIMARCAGDPKVQRLAGEITANFGRGYPQSGSRKMLSRRFGLYHLASNDSKISAFRYGLHLLFSPTRQDWLLFPVPASCWFFLYVLRPFRLLFELVIRS